jgi:hypothetical protein
MRSRVGLKLGVVAVLALSGATVASADEGYRHGRLRFVEPGTTLQRATETESEEAIQNLPFLPGDRIWTDDGGRAEFQFPDGTVVRLDRRGKLDYAGHEEERQERIVLRLWSGSVIVHAPSRASLQFEIESPAGLVEALERSVVRVDVDGGDTRVSVYEGEAVFGGVRLRVGERTTARWGERPEEAEGFDRFDADDFLQWDEERESDERWASGSARYLPDELDPYSGEFERHGDWRYEGGVSTYVWVPRVDHGWQPYSHGRWAWTPYGWTWVPYERWGWAPFHYGRWGHSASVGWYWIPGRTWGPGWVSWAVGGGYVGWCPLGWRDRPITPWGQWRSVYGGLDGRGRAVPRRVYGGEVSGWNVVRQGELHRPGDIRRARVDVQRVDPGALRVAESPLHRPTRDVAMLRPADAAPRAIRTRPTPGDYVRELAVDNKTTIPAPWTRGYGPPPAGVEGARYGANPPDSAADPQASRARGAVPRGSATREERREAQTGGVASAPRSAPRPAPWYEPRTENTPANRPATRVPAGHAERRAPRPGDGATVERPRRDADIPAGSAPRQDETAPARGGGTVYRPRDAGEQSGSGGAYRPQGDSSTSRAPQSEGYRSSGDGGGARPRNDGGGSGYRPQRDGASRPQQQSSGGGLRSQGSGSGGGAPRPAPSGGGEARSAGGGNSRSGGAVARPRGNRD